MIRQVGEVDWTATGLEKEEDKKDFKKLPFLSMRTYNKVYRVRVVSKPLMYHCHWVDINGKQQKVKCSLTKDCPVKDPKTNVQCKGQKARAGYYIKVIDREDNQVKVLDVGPQIIKAIAQLHQDEDWGDVKDYDIKIFKGAAGANPLYSVTPAKRSELTAEELEMVKITDDKTLPDGNKNPEYFDIERLCKPLTVELIKKLIGEGEDEEVEVVKEPTRKAGRTPSAVTKTPASEDDDGDMITWDDND